MEFKFKEVYFDKYCKKCIHKDKKENEPPCDECMEYAVNEYSHKPVKFKEKV